MQPPARTVRRFSLRSRTFCVSVSLLSLIAVVLPLSGYAIPEHFPSIPADGFALVERGPMEVVVSQVGNIDSAGNVFLVNQCEFSTRIISIIPEGTQVQAGDVIAELDSSNLKQLALQREVLLVNAEAALKQAEEDLRMQKLRNESRYADADLVSRLAQLKLEGYEEAEYPRQLHALEGAVAMAEEAVTRGEEMFRFARRMVTLGYRNRSEEETQRLALIRSRQELEQARDRLRVLEEFTHQRQLKQLEALAEEATAQLDRVQKVNHSAILGREIRLQTYQRSYLVYKNYLDRLNRSIEACTIRAPRDGEVIYGIESSSSSRAIQEGSPVRYLQMIAKLPDREHLQVHLRVHESQVHLLDQGQPAIVATDAARGETFRGRVSKVSSVPLSPRHPNYDLREYGVVVDIERDSAVGKLLAPGMTATANIVAAERQSAVKAPIQSIVEVAGRRVAFVRRGDNVEPRELETGLSNNDTMEILSGLEAGEEVVLKPRVTCAQRIVALEGRYLARHSESSGWLGFQRSAPSLPLAKATHAYRPGI